MHASTRNVNKLTEKKMPVNAASKSIKLADDIAEKHDVQFVVHSELAGADVEQLNHHLGDHLQYMRTLMVSAHPGTGLWHPHSVLKIAA